MSTLFSRPPLIPMVTLLTMVSHVTNTPEAAIEMEITVGGADLVDMADGLLTFLLRPAHIMHLGSVGWFSIESVEFLFPKASPLAFFNTMDSWPFWPNFSSTWAAPLCPYPIRAGLTHDHPLSNPMF